MFTSGVQPAGMPYKQAPGLNFDLAHIAEAHALATGTGLTNVRKTDTDLAKVGDVAPDHLPCYFHLRISCPTTFIRKSSIMYKITKTFDQFKAETGLNGKPKQRGANILAIDLRFQLYEGSFMTADDGLRMQLALGLYEACKTWLELKQTKKTTHGIFETKNKNLIKRRIAIADVAKLCIQSLRNAKMVYPEKLSFNTRKIDMLEKGRAGIQPTPLSGDYSTERQTWVGSGKTVSIAGHLHASQEDMKNLGLDQGNFNGMSQEEYSAFLKDKPKHVLYFKKDDRLTTLMDFGDEGLTVYPGDRTRLMNCITSPFDRTNPNAYIEQLQMYAMDQWGNLFSVPDPAFKDLQNMTYRLGQNRARISNFNHSSFNAGKDVLSAGLIGFANGYITWIDNNSGHYKPTRTSLKNAIKFMYDEGRDLSQLMVAAYHYHPGGGISAIQVHTRDNFLRNVDGVGDITTI